MKKVIVLAFLVPTVFFAQSVKDINVVVQKTIDLYALSEYFSEGEKKGEIPLVIINDDKIPNNLIIFKFKKRVKILTEGGMEYFDYFKNSLNSYFVFEELTFKDDQVSIRASFRKDDKIAINVDMKKENDQWKIVDSSAG